MDAGLLHDYTFRTVALGAALLGAVSGGLGTFAVLRRQSLLGDAMSHAALPGIALAFVLTGSKASLVLMLGAGLAGWLGTLAIAGIVGSSRVKYDSALALVLSVFFGFGLVLLTWIQGMPTASQAGLDKYLFGQAAALLASDVATMAVLGAAALAVVALGWKEFKLLSFDPDFAASLGWPVRGLDVLLTTLLVVAIVIGLQAVGVVLMSALVVAPAAAARQWTHRLGPMMLLAALFGALAGVAGALVSSTTAHLPTGPAIVVALSVVVFASMAFAPARGLVWAALRRRRQRGRLRTEAVLRDLHCLAGQHEDPAHAHDEAVLRAMGSGAVGVSASLRALAEQGLVTDDGQGRWALTAAGVEEARRLEQAERPGQERAE